MIDSRILKQKLASIDGQDYGSYQSLRGIYDFPLFKLIIQQIPKDPYAPPHTGIYRVQLQREALQTVSYQDKSKWQRIAFADYLARRFHVNCQQHSAGLRGTGYSGLITINQPGQAILQRNSVVITDEVIEVRCFLGLPASGRKINARLAEQMFLGELPKIVQASLQHEGFDYPQLQRHIEAAEDAQYLRNRLDALGLVAFVENGAILPRASGTSDQPLTTNDVVPLMSPQSLWIEIELPHAGRVQGMGIPKGITLITGGGYHGKSTLLNGLERGIYNHIPGDGRERCVSTANTVKVRAYSGRNIASTDISAFINNLPFGKDTTAFTTDNASGSTSQAATIVEAIEVGADVLLMDEDTCATNFMSRDYKMQQLIGREEEPITTFIDKVKQLYREKNVSTILAVGGIGDYFDVADQVIQMLNFQPRDVTRRARDIARRFPAKRIVEREGEPFTFHHRCPRAKSIVPTNAHGKFSIHAKEVHRINFGRQVVDLTDLEQLTELSQAKAIAYAIDYARQFMTEDTSLLEVVQTVIRHIDRQGLDIISDRISGHFAAFRGLELAFAINRLRGLAVIQQETGTVDRGEPVPDNC